MSRFNKDTAEFEPFDEEMEAEEELLEPEEDEEYETEYVEEPEDDEEESYGEEEEREMTPEEWVRQKRLKKRKRKQLRRKMILPTILILLALAGGAFAFAHSSYFQIEKVKVSGNSYYTASQIREMSGIKKGVNIFFDVDTAAVEKKLEEDSYIESVKITRKLPGTLMVTVRERGECAAVYSGKKYYIIDYTGYIVKITKKKPSATRVYNLKVTSGKVGKSLEVKQNAQLNSTLALLGDAAGSTVDFKAVYVKEKTVKAYVYKKLYVRGKVDDIRACIASGKLEAVLYDLYERGVKNGMIRVGSDQYCVYNPDVD